MSSAVPVAEPLRAEPVDQRDVRERLDVLHQRARAAETALERVGGLQRRLGRAAVQRLQKRRLLAGDEPVGHRRGPRIGPCRDCGSPVRARRPRARARGGRSPTTTSRAPIARAASAAPSSTRWGATRSSERSFFEAGSPSAPLATTTGRPRPAASTASLVAVGNAAPPRPCSAAASTVSIRSARCRGGPKSARWRASVGGWPTPARSRADPSGGRTRRCSAVAVIRSRRTTSLHRRCPRRYLPGCRSTGSHSGRAGRRSRP